MAGLFFAIILSDNPGTSLRPFQFTRISRSGLISGRERISRRNGGKSTRKGADGSRVTDDKSGRLAKAMLAVGAGQSLNSAAREHRIGKATLHRHYPPIRTGHLDRSIRTANRTGNRCEMDI
jgi:hypothetical protein